MAWHGVSRGEHGACLLCCGRGYRISPRGDVPAFVRPIPIPILLVLVPYSGRTRAWTRTWMRMRRTQNPFLLSWNIPQHINTTRRGARRVQNARAGTEEKMSPWVVAPSYPIPFPSPSHPPRRIRGLYQEVLVHGVRTTQALAQHSTVSPHTRPGTNARHSPTTHINLPRYPRGNYSIVTLYRHARWHAPRRTLPLARGVAGAAVLRCCGAAVRWMPLQCLLHCGTVSMHTAVGMQTAVST